jgi:DNA-binding MarR family transcriptional regulator
MPDQQHLQAQADVFGGVFILVQYLSRLTDAALRDWGLTTRQWLLLAVLNKAYPDHAPSLTEAAEVYRSSRQNVKQIALGLEARGFLHLVPDPGDGRTTLIERTGKERMFDEPDGQARAAALLAQAFDGLSRADTLALQSIVGRWVGRLAEQWGAAGRRDVRAESAPDESAVSR